MNMNESVTSVSIISICPQGERHCPDVPWSSEFCKYFEAQRIWSMCQEEAKKYEIANEGREGASKNKRQYIKSQSAAEGGCEEALQVKSMRNRTRRCISTIRCYHV